MARGYRPVDREQPFLLPPSMTEWLPADHLVWFVIDVVQRLDTAVFHRRARRGGVGRAGYDPDMLVTLLVYAMAAGLRSSRRIEALCHTDVAFRIICAGDVPDHTVIARFRQDHEAALGDLLTESLVLSARLGLIRLGVVTLDGVKIAGNASRDANRGRDALRRLAVEHLAAAATTDQAEDALFGAGKRGDEIPEKLRDRTRRGTRIQQALDELAVQAEAETAQRAARDAVTGHYRDRQQHAAATGDRAPRGRRPKAIDAVTAAKARWDTERIRQQARIDAWQARQAVIKATGGRRRGSAPLPVEQHSRVRAARAAYDQALAAAQAEHPDTAHPTTAEHDSDQHHSDQHDSDQDSTSSPRRKPRRRGPRVNLTDPQSRLLHTRNGWIQGYNCLTSTSQDRFILHTQATQDANDVQHLVPAMNTLASLAQQLGTVTGRDDLTLGLLLADAGYDSVTNLTTPGPPRLIPSRHYRTRNTSAHPPPPDATARQHMDHQLQTPEGKTLYRQRSPQAETSHAWLKDRRGLRHFTRRGQTAAHHELRFAAAVTNLLRLRTLTT